MVDHEILINFIVGVCPREVTHCTLPTVTNVVWRVRLNGEKRIRNECANTTRDTGPTTLQRYMNKLCKDCKKSKNINKFRCKSINMATGTATYATCCLPCEKIRSDKWFKAHHDKKIEYGRKNYQKYKEEHRARGRANYYKNREARLKQQKIYKAKVKLQKQYDITQGTQNK